MLHKRGTVIALLGVLMAVSVVLVMFPDLTGSTRPESITDAKTNEATIVQSVTEDQAEEAPVMKKQYQAYTPENIKAMWLSQFDLNAVYTAVDRQRAKSEYQILIERVLDRVAQTGINTVIVQLRPNMDSMYPSEICPMSKYVVGKYGFDAKYDPFAILLEEAHERGLSVHAWINPLRGMLTEELLAISDQYPVRQIYNNPAKRDKVLVEHDGRWYLNPAYEEARELIVNGAREILTRYDVDGLHMDDYFYPSGCRESFDESAYLAHLRDKAQISLSAFRRLQINKLVRELYAMVKETNESVLFGISPGGNMDTNYNRLGADVYTWCSQKGYIDYICPQVYWGMEHETYDFVSVCQTFADMIKVDGIRLVIGMTLGKAKSKYDPYAGSGQWEWRDHTDILYRCLQHTKSLEHCVGVSYFCYQYFYDPISGASVPETQAERRLFVPLLKDIQWNSTNG